MNEFTINAKLPSLNDYIGACRANKYKGATFKRDVEEVIIWAIKQAQAKGTLKPTDKPCKVIFEWYEKSSRRDADNIASSKKFILDALQKSGIIPNDNQKYIKGFTDEIHKSNRDYVVVKLYEYSENNIDNQI